MLHSFPLCLGLVVILAIPRLGYVVANEHIVCAWQDLSRKVAYSARKNGTVRALLLDGDADCDVGFLQLK